MGIAGLLGFGLAASLAAAEPIDLTVWRHQTGEVEMAESAAAVQRFNAGHPNYRVRMETLPQGSYAQAVTAAALSGKLPCAMTLDQPSVPNFARAGYLRPLEGALQPQGADALIPGARSHFKGKLYAVGQFDVSLAIFARASVLQRYGVRVATRQRPYTAVEFRDILRRLKQAGVKYPLDLNSQLDGEWVAYGFAPWLQSAGADLVDRRSYTQSDGFLNSDAAVGVADYYQSLFVERLTPRRPLDDQAFAKGRAVFHYTGSWSADTYLRRFGRDLLALPALDFGHGPKIGSGSWQWAISSTCKAPDAARQFIEFMISTDEIVALSDATGLMPTSQAAADRSREFRAGAFGRVFFEDAKAFAVPRPETPAYPMISSSFERAFQTVREGGDAADALDNAVEAIQLDLKRNRNYGF